MKKFFFSMMALICAMCVFAQKSDEVVLSRYESGAPKISIKYDITDGVMTLTAGQTWDRAYSLASPRPNDKFDYAWNNSDKEIEAMRQSVKTIIFDFPIDSINSGVFLGFNNVETLKFSENVTGIPGGIDPKSFVLKGSEDAIAMPSSQLKSIYFYGITSVPSLSADESELDPFWCPEKQTVKVYVPDYTNPASGLKLIDRFMRSNEYWGSTYASISLLPGVPMSDGMTEEGNAEITWGVVETATAYHLTIVDEDYVTLLDTTVLANGTTGELVTKPLSINRRRIVLDQTVITIDISMDFDTEGQPTVKAEVSNMNTEKSYRMTIESIGAVGKLLTSSKIDFGMMPEAPTNAVTVTSNTPVRKYITNGQMVILHGDKQYGLRGEVVNL